MQVIYHTLNPHPGLSPPPDPSDPQTIRKQLENEVVYRRLLAQGTLAVLLPTEDLENSCLRTLVGDVLADLILGDEIGGKVCEGWFVWTAVSRLISVVLKHEAQNETDGEETQDIQRSRLERFGLLSPKKELSSSDLSGRERSSASIWMWRILQGAYLVCMGTWFLLTGLLRAALPTSAGEIISSPITPSPINRANEAPSWTAKTATRRPILDYKLFGMMSQLLDVPRRMPWLEGMLSLLRYGLLMGPGKLGETDRILNR
jgi:PXA domain